MENFSVGNVNATIHFAVSYCVLGESKKTAIDYGTASLDVEREKICISPDAFMTRLKLTNTSGTMLKLIVAYPIMTDDMEIGESVSRNWSVYNGSRQQNDVPATCILGEKDNSFAEAVNRLSEEGVMRRDFTAGDTVLYGDGITVIKSGKTYVALEVMTNDNQLTDISISSDCNGDVKAIRLGGEFNCLMDNGEVLYTDWVRISVGGNLIRLLDDYALDRKAMAPLSGAVAEKTMICALDGNLKYEAVSERLAFLRSLKAPFTYVELGNGWQSKIGDWEDGDGINTVHLASAINKSGYKAGLWTSPFLVERESELYETQKNWVLRHADGSACTYVMNGTTYAVLDVSSADFLEWLEMTYKRLSALGFYMHHVDHTMAFVIQKDIILHDPKLTVAMAYKRAMKTIAEAIGEVGYMYVTNGFMPLLDGVAHAVQICSDIDTMQNKEGSNVFPRLVNQCTYRSYMSNWWQNVCPAGIDGDLTKKYSQGEIKYILACHYITNSAARVSDIENNEQLKVLKYIYPGVRTNVYPRDAFCENAFVSVVDVEINESFHTLCFFNNSFAEVDLTFRLDSNSCGGYVDRAGVYNVSSYFGRNFVLDAKFNDIIRLGTIKPNSCEIVKIAKTNKPQVLLSDMHFSMGGEVEITSNEYAVTVKGNNPFNCRGSYVIALPENMQCTDGKREFSFTVNGAGAFSYEKQIKRI